MFTWIVLWKVLCTMIVLLATWNIIMWWIDEEEREGGPGMKYYMPVIVTCALILLAEIWLDLLFTPLYLY